MNKLVRLFSVLALASTVAFVSCKGDKGDTGPQGAAGPQGVQGTGGATGDKGDQGDQGDQGDKGDTGNSNIVSFMHTAAVADWAPVDVPALGGGSTSKWGGVAIPSELVMSNSNVLGFITNGETTYPLPLTLAMTADVDAAIESLFFGYKTGQINAYYKKSGSGVPDDYMPDSDITFKFIVVEETLTPAMKAAGVDLSNYDEVVNYLNRSVQVPTQL